MEKVIRRRDDTNDDWSCYIDSTYCIESIKGNKMKKLIMDILADMAEGQINLGSEAARENIASKISEALIENGTYTKDSEMDKQVAREKEKWVCSICGKNTYSVDYDYIGSGTNHLGCELKIEMGEKFIDESNKNPVPKQHERIIG